MKKYLRKLTATGAVLLVAGGLAACSEGATHASVLSHDASTINQR